MSVRQVRSASGCGLEVYAMRLPSGLQAGCSSRAVSAVRRSSLPSGQLEQPQLGRVLEDVALAVEHVLQPVDQLGCRPGRQLPHRALRSRSPVREPIRGRADRPSGLQRSVGHVLRHSRQLMRLATVHGQQPDLDGAFLDLLAARPDRHLRRPSPGQTPRSDRKARLWPSGLQRGEESLLMPSVSWRAGAEPSAGTIQTPCGNHRGADWRP